MKGHRRAEAGFTIVEVLVTMMLLGIVTTAFYSVMFSATRSSNVTEDVVRVSEEARLGLNRMIRDTREANILESVTNAAGQSPSYTIRVDFNGDGSYANTPGNVEVLTYTYVPSTKVLTLNNEVLTRGVEPIPGEEIFSYSSNHLEWDASADGVTTWQEVDAWPNAAIGNNNGKLDAPDINQITSIHYAMRINQDGRSADFFSEAQLRNRR